MDILNLPVFPAADVFPMMDADELADLAADIGANGLRAKLMLGELDGVTTLIDGRNRRRACEMAGVEPEVEYLNGADPLAYVDSSELRRHLTTGRRAMGYAIRHPEPVKLKRKGISENGEQTGVSPQRLQEARAVLAHSRSLADQVILGDVTLGAAFVDMGADQGSARNTKRRLAKLRESRPDLAELVDNEAMEIGVAATKADKDAEEYKQLRWAATMNIIDSVRGLDRPPEDAVEQIALYDPAHAESRGETLSPERLRRASNFLACMADAMGEDQCAR